MSDIKEFTLREALAKRGWPEKYLRWDTRAARLDRRGGRSGFVPFSGWQRLLHSRDFIPINRLIVPGTLIRFDGLLRDDRMFAGLVEPMPDSEFPYDDYLKVLHHDQFDFLAGDRKVYKARAREAREGPRIISEMALALGEKSVWRVSYIVLTYLHEVSIKTTKID